MISLVCLLVYFGLVWLVWLLVLLSFVLLCLACLLALLCNAMICDGRIGRFHLVRLGLSPLGLSPLGLVWLGRLARWHALDFEQKTHEIYRKGHLPAQELKLSMIFKKHAYLGRF